MTDPSKPRAILLDTNCFIYLLESVRSPHGRYMDTLMRTAARGSLTLATSAVCLSEFLVGVARNGSELDVRRMMARFLALPGLTVSPVTNEIAAAAAQLRGRAGMRLFDAIIVATGVSLDVDEFLTNDAVLARAATSIPTTYLEDVAT